MEANLMAYSIGDVPEYLAEEGLEQAQYYFEMKDLAPQECFNAYEIDPDSTLGQHWLTAGQRANLVLAGNRLNDNSLICLEMELIS